MITRLIVCFVCLLVSAHSVIGQNYALQFNGVDERATMETTLETTLSQSYSIEAWINARTWRPQSWQGSIITNDSGVGNGGFAFRCGNDGRLSIAVSANNNWNEALSDVVMTTNKWHHVAATVDQGTITLYVDGASVALATFQGDPAASTRDITIGESTGFPGRFFDGVIDEVRIWSVARSAADIASNIFTTFNGDEDGLAAYLPMNEGTGTLVSNLADNNIPATMINMDDSNWVDGFSASEYDIAVIDLTQIDRIALKTRPIRPSVTIQNVGALPIDNMTATVMIDGNVVSIESIDMTIEPGTSENYTISSPLDLRGVTNPEISVSISQPDDNNTFNNTASIMISSRNGLTVNIFDEEQHNFGTAGQRQTKTVSLPGDLSAYDQIRLRLDVNCPSTGCDPWDQPASLKIITDQGIFELARYITPFGIGCGPWYVDVTDFKSVLTGEVTFESFVQVWGPSGWLIDMDLEFEPVSDLPTYSKLSGMHSLDYQVYGDPDISYDLDGVALQVADNTETSHVRMQVSGHGQGNTSNAAEFFRRNHQLLIDGVSFANHDLWKEDCNINSCSNQLGTWLFARAGWCPGQEVIPAIFNTSQEVSAGQDFEFDYQLQNYTNFLNTGYNSGSHTEPHYRIHSFFVENSSSRFGDYTNLALTEISLGMNQVIVEITNDGSIDLSNYQVMLYADGEVLAVRDVATTIASSNTTTIIFDTDLEPLLNNLIVAEVLVAGDENLGDNLLGDVNNGSVGVEDEIGEDAFSIFPIPSEGQVTLRVTDELIGGTWTLLSIDGRELNHSTIGRNETVLYINESGFYLLNLETPKGVTISKRIVID